MLYVVSRASWLYVVIREGELSRNPSWVTAQSRAHACPRQLCAEGRTLGRNASAAQSTVQVGERWASTTLWAAAYTRARCAAPAVPAGGRRFGAHRRAAAARRAVAPTVATSARDPAARTLRAPTRLPRRAVSAAASLPPLGQPCAWPPQHGQSRRTAACAAAAPPHHQRRPALRRRRMPLWRAHTRVEARRRAGVRSGASRRCRRTSLRLAHPLARSHSLPPTSPPLAGAPRRCASAPAAYPWRPRTRLEAVQLPSTATVQQQQWSR